MSDTESTSPMQEDVIDYDESFCMSYQVGYVLGLQSDNAAKNARIAELERINKYVLAQLAMNNKTYSVSLYGWLDAADKWDARIAELEAENARLREGLINHGHHSPNCSYVSGSQFCVGDCDCGLELLLAEPAKESEVG